MVVIHQQQQQLQQQRLAASAERIASPSPSSRQRIMFNTTQQQLTSQFPLEVENASSRCPICHFKIDFHLNDLTLAAQKDPASTIKLQLQWRSYGD